MNFPAFFLILRIGKVIVPVPWFLGWIFGLIVLPFCILAGHIGLIFSRHHYVYMVLSRSHHLLKLLMFIRGLQVSVLTGDSTQVNLNWI